MGRPMPPMWLSGGGGLNGEARVVLGGGRIFARGERTRVRRRGLPTASEAADYCLLRTDGRLVADTGCSLWSGGRRRPMATAPTQSPVGFSPQPSSGKRPVLDLTSPPRPHFNSSAASPPRGTWSKTRLIARRLATMSARSTLRTILTSDTTPRLILDIPALGDCRLRPTQG